MRNKHLSSRRGLIQQLRLATVLFCFKIIIQAIVNIISMRELRGPNSVVGVGVVGAEVVLMKASMTIWLQITNSRQLLLTSALSRETQKWLS